MAAAQQCQLFPPTPATLQALFDAGIWYALSLWPALQLACQNSWGGPASADKKDWLAGAVSSLFAARRDTDQEDVELLLLQVMQDEFECNVEDDSEVEVARSICGLRQRLMGGDVDAAAELEARWRNRGQMKMHVQLVDRGDQEVDGEEFEGFDDEDEGGDEDVDVDVDASEGLTPNLASSLAEKREKPAPELDEDGFTKVVGKKR